MKTAMYDGTEVTPSEFRRLAGSTWKALGRWPVCKICDNRVHPNFEHSLTRNARFDHVDDVSYCPLSSKADPRYAGLRPTEIDLHAIERVRTVFLETPLYSRAMDFFDYHIGSKSLDHETAWMEMLHKADTMKIWGYRNLALWTLPYILLTLIDFKLSSQHGMPFEVQFRFIKPASGLIDDLWLRPEMCRLEKVYRDSGRLTQYPLGNPYPVNEAYLWASGIVEMAHLLTPPTKPES